MKRARKLTIERETLRTLAARELSVAHGGVFTDRCGSDQGSALCTLGGGCGSGGCGGGPPHTLDVDCPPLVTF